MTTQDTAEQTTTHTPGPWHAGQRFLDGDPEGVSYILTGNRHEVAVIYGGAMEFDSPEERIANAHLIAAAPDLLAALKDLLTLITTFDRANLSDFQHRLDAARAAIQKADGGR